MPNDIDKIVEAEESIQKIAGELKRLKNAATLLENSQEQNASVLTSAESVFIEIQRLVETFKGVVSNLSSLNINQRLLDIETRVKQIEEFNQKHSERTSNAFDKIGSEIDQLQTSTQEFANNATKSLSVSDDKLEDIRGILNQSMQKRGLFSRLFSRK